MEKLIKEYAAVKSVDCASTRATVILPFEKKGEHYIESLENIKPLRIYSFVKRAFDIVASFIALVLLAIPMLCIGIAVKIDSPGPVLYKQERLGKNGKPFNLVKFRSMCNEAEDDGAQWSQGDEDPRITKVGAFLRKTRLDELPQFWTIFTGTMTLVGPRPERAVFYEEFETYIHGFSERMRVKPGLTGLAQINGGYDLKPEEKIVYDVQYIKNRSIWNDLKIIMGTVKIVFTHEGAK